MHHYPSNLSISIPILLPWCWYKRYNWSIRESNTMHTPVCQRNDRNPGIDSLHLRTKMREGLPQATSPARLDTFFYKFPHSIPGFWPKRVLFKSCVECLCDLLRKASDFRYNWIFHWTMDWAVKSSIQVIVIHKGYGYWSAKLPTESNGTLSMNIFNMSNL